MRPLKRLFCSLLLSRLLFIGLYEAVFGDKVINATFVMANDDVGNELEIHVGGGQHDFFSKPQN